MKKIFSKTAYTLIELIVSLLLASFVVLGIYSIDQVLNNNAQDYGQRYLVKSGTQTTLNHEYKQIMHVADAMYGYAKGLDIVSESWRCILTRIESNTSSNLSLYVLVLIFDMLTALTSEP